jgi:hypothetical protein
MKLLQTVKSRLQIATYVNEKAISQTEKNRDRNQKIAIAELWEPSFRIFFIAKKNPDDIVRLVKLNVR